MLAKSFLTTLGLLLLSHIPMYAQKHTVTGKITDAQTGEALNGVSVRIKGSGIGTFTNQNGQYNLQVQPNNEIEITMITYKTITIPVGDQSVIDIKLERLSSELEQVILIGSRRSGRVKMETPVPVDIVNVGQVALPTARMDLTALMNYSAPSLNYNKQSGSDGADHIDLATLRGLGPDQTLVLINGKRRHQTAFVAVFGTRGRGNSGTDLSAIPIGAIDRVEILRDGASAQYGSDAIAGVINIILKKNVNQFTGNIGWSGYYDKKYNPQSKPDLGMYEYGSAIDGNSVSFNGNYGVPLGKNGGFINLTANFLSSGKTFRQAMDTNSNSKNFMIENTVRRAHGDGSVVAGGGFFNAEIPVKNSRTTFYSFGGFNYKSTDAFAFSRNFSAKPERFVTTPDFQLIDIPGLIKTDRTGDRYFDPHIQSKIRDYSFAAGVRGSTNNHWNWDVSNVTGDNNFHFYGDKTVNASSSNPNKTHFDDGGFSFLQNTLNVNFSKEFPKVLQGFNLAFGAEYRYERYKLFAGEEASYKNFDPNKFYTDGSDKIYVAAGAQGFPGFQPGDEVNANRSTIGGYVDAELDITKKFLTGLAFRYENYSDFGSTFNFKFATRYKVTDNFNLRGSFSTGFRAPSLQQINFSSSFTTVQGGTIAEVKIAPNYSPITRAAGIPELKQEKSINASVGFTWKPSSALSVTIDGYWVRIKDRVVISGQFDAGDPDLDPQLIAAMKQLNVSLAQFFANAVNTTNRGIDIVIEYNKKIGAGNFKTLLTGNIQSMDIDKINVPAKLNNTPDLAATFLTEREQQFILSSAPKTKFGLNLEYNIRKFTAGLRLTYFGKIRILGYGDGTSDDFEGGFHRGDLFAYVPADADNRPVKDEYIYNGKVVPDIYFGYKLSKNLHLFVGADNIFNVHPDLGVAKGAKFWAFNNETGGPWDAVQMGVNGLRMFARLGITF
ncbi:TonB-dependent receptor [Pseudoflavitalea sp. G-6-1-2]|uniref:TonB-dependent receptor n=1 Tax=Pseudoflavitalea sp. G-6-1-2 TaxID=2728841 RepID=UPI00146BCC2F|nr:TonB-dependent receptor [Pseudoflavitalea sp. G-6-1-2]NML19623.1 TonB-dependent receptor [Pseudoflavitalea sp. G-6-1-2]